MSDFRPGETPEPARPAARHFPGGDGARREQPGPRLPAHPGGRSGDPCRQERRRVLISGGSSGIGAAAAGEFAARGYLVAVTGRDERALDLVARATGGVPVPGDLREPGCPRRVVDAAAAALGGLDVVVSNAGLGWAGSFAEMTAQEVDELLDVNLRAPAHMAHAALAHLRPGTGHLVFVGSIAGLLGVPGETWYSATKAGVSMLADALRAELRAERIGLSLVVPGVVDTPYFERRKAPYQRSFPRPLAAQVVAAAIADAAEQRPDMVIIPGWLGWPARLKGAFPSFYRRLERSLDAAGPSNGRRWHGRKRAAVVRPAGPWP